MYRRECRICGTAFDAKTERRNLCDECQKDPHRAQNKIDKAIFMSKMRLGELPEQQYYECECLQCGQKFHRYGHSSAYCSTECHQQYRAEHAVCRICAKPLYPLGIVVKSGFGCCSDDCEQKYRWQLALDKGRVARCKLCGTEFIQKKMYDEFCGRECKGKYKELHSKSQNTNTPVELNPVQSECVICGKVFTHHPNAKQYTCGKECSATRTKQLNAKKREAKQKEKNKEKNQVLSPAKEREKLVNGVLNGEITGASAKSLHLCTTCKTSQSMCVMFESGFVYHPQDAVIRAIEGSNIVLICPQYNC